MRRTIGLLALTNLWLLYTTPFARSAEECPPAQTQKIQRASKAQPPSLEITRNGSNVTMHFSGKSSANAVKPSGPLDIWPCQGKLQPSRRAALENALQVADAKLVEYLRQFRPDINWPQRDIRAFVMRMNDDLKTDTPMLEESNRETLKKKFGIDLSSEELKSEIGDKQFWVAEVQLNLTREIKEDLLYKLRLDEAKQRQWWMAKLMLAALALFGTLGLYYRFDERTKGYYTNWLRVGALAMLALAGYGIVHLP
jgi:hypothetical protein